MIFPPNMTIIGIRCPSLFCARAIRFGLRPKYRTGRGPRYMAATRNAGSKGRGYA